MSNGLRVALFIFFSVPGLVIVAFVASRLLGVRRSWLAVLASSLVGWLVGFFVSLTLATGLDDTRLFRNTVILAFVFTMATEVAIDLLARPGSFGKAGDPLAFRLPNPRSYIRSRLDVVRRTREIVEVANRNGFGPHIGLRHRGDWAAARRQAEPVRVRQVLEQCGGMFVKLGQLISTRTDLIPKDYAEELSKLQKEVAPEPPEAMRALIEEELGAPVDQVFAAFDWEPMGTASIAQVYRATLVTGEPVVVKAQRPGVAAVVERDSKVLVRLTRLAERNTTWGAEYNIGALAGEFVAGVQAELDFRSEAENAKAIRANTQVVERVRVPKVYEHLSTARVLVQERLDGPTVADWEAVDAMNPHREELADDLLRAALKQMTVDGWFHADLHPGNVVVLSADELGIIDFGACGRLDPLEQSALRQMLIATSLRDPVLLRQAVSDVCDIPREVDDEALERALARFLAVNVPAGGGVGAHAVADLLAMLATFGIDVPVELTTFGRALVQLEGTLRTLAPGYSFTDAAQRLAEEWVTAEQPTSLGDLDRVVRKEVLSLLPTLRSLPTRVDGALRQLEHGDISVRTSLFSREGDTQFVSKMVNRVVLAFLGAVLGVVSALLLSTTHGLPFAGEVTLLQLFGYLGLFGAAVLMLRVVAAVVRDGLN